MTEIVTDKKPVVKKEAPVKPEAKPEAKKPHVAVSGRRATHAEIMQQQSRARAAQAEERRLEKEAISLVRKQLAAAKK